MHFQVSELTRPPSTCRPALAGLPAARALALALALSTASLAGAVEPPSFDASDPTAAVVTAENLLESERFWPYQILLVESWTPPNRETPLPAGTRAVLVRVEESGLVRADFGRDGVFELAAASTDVVARANQVRLATLPKTAPNFVLAVGPRLTDTAYDGIRPVPFDRVYEPRGFVAVFAAPDRFEELARELAPLQGRNGTWTLLFPQGRVDDAQIRTQLRALGWPVPFLFDTYSEAYTHSRLPTGASPPAVMLQTPEGRVLYQASWEEGGSVGLTEALDRHFVSAGATP